MFEQSETKQTWPKTSGPVLVVEDDPAINTLLEMALEEAGYPVEIAWNGLEALKYLGQPGQPAPALILLDLTMPVMDGRQFLTALQTETRPTGQNIPVVVMTASRQKVAVGEENGVVGYLPKPFELDELLNYVGRFVLV